MHGVRRVILFCSLIMLLPIILLGIPLYLRHRVYTDVVYAVTESDILEISNGVSTVFCSSQTLKMNGTFNAFQMDHRPEITTYRKHIRLKKSMTLPDDTLEYWGFYLLQGATVALSVCSRFPGASILVVKGDRSFSTCGMLDHNKNKVHTTGMYMPQANEQVKITFESNAQIIDFEEPSKTVTHRNVPPSEKHNNAKPKKHKDRKITGNKTRIMKDEEFEKVAETYGNKIIDDGEPVRKNVTRKLRHAKKHHRTKKIHARRRHKEEKTVERKLSKDSFERQNHLDSRRIAKRETNSARITELKRLEEELNSPNDEEGSAENEEIEISNGKHIRKKRNHGPVEPPALLDHGIQHGGNALRNSSESSVSSFEEGLLNCYEGQVLLAQEFEPSELCTNVSYLVNGKYMQTRHDVTEDGYYYYIFYSDNDIVFNDIHALFDIYKPTFQYENVTKSCVNKTECTFPLEIFSKNRVIVEVPTKDGIDHEQDDISLLVSVCHPRMAIYTIFPIAVLFLILCCAFM